MTKIASNFILPYLYIGDEELIISACFSLSSFIPFFKVFPFSPPTPPNHTGSHICNHFSRTDL